MWNRFKGWFIRFMSGRYGVDALNRFLMWSYLILFLLGAITDLAPLSLISLVIGLFMILRIFSRNRTARIKENNRYLAIKSKFLGFFKLQKAKMRDRKTHVFRKCPACKADIRLPKVKGAHTVKCPRCSNRFDVNI